MSENSKIEWCDHTFNPWEGCEKVSPGCKNCYAEARNKRWGGGVAKNWGHGASRRRTSENNWKQPLKWNRAAEFAEVRPRVFCASLADWLDPAVDPQWLSDLLFLISATRHLDWLLLTKRPQLFRERMESVMALNDVSSQIAARWLANCDSPPHNIWVGTSVEDQARAQERIPELYEIPARIRFLSCEPLLEAVNLWDWLCEPICPLVDWVIVGGESGSNARVFSPDWARELQAQCLFSVTPFFMKQMGGTRKPFPEIPAELMVREFPRSRGGVFS